MFKGGCYAAANAPGNTMCTSAASGVCSAAADGYFLPPTADRDASHQSVIPCGDDSVVTGKDDKKYKGVLHCTQCSTPATADDTSTPKAATCTACEDGYFVDTAACTKCHESCLTCADGTPDKCKSCTPETHFLGATSGQTGKCVSCGDATGSGGWTGVAGCAKCTKPETVGAATCTECQVDRYLKAKVGDTAETCETKETCTGGYFPKDETTGGNKCVKCSDTNNGGIENCSTCTPIESPTTTVLVTCSACESNKKVSPGGSSCVPNCPENSSEQSGACVCSSGFAPNGDGCAASSSGNLSIGTIVEYL